MIFCDMFINLLCRNHTLNSICPPYWNERLSVKRFLPWTPRDAVAMSLNTLDGNLKAIEVSSLLLNLTFEVSLDSALVCWSTSEASLKNCPPLVLKTVWFSTILPRWRSWCSGTWRRNRTWRRRSRRRHWTTQEECFWTYCFPPW